MKAFLSIEINKPDLSKLSEITDEIFSPSFSKEESAEWEAINDDILNKFDTM